MNLIGEFACRELVEPEGREDLGDKREGKKILDLVANFGGRLTELT